MRYPTVIIGAGISGITAAVELAEAGREVVLLEKEPYLGGNVSRFNNYFPKFCPPSCGLEINYRRIRSHPAIRYYTGAEVTGIGGFSGEFRVRVTLQARRISNLCTACGKCAEICPVEKEGGYQLGDGQKAAYIREELAFPMKYTIDNELCQGRSCGRCLEVCEYNAIDLDAKDGEVTLVADRIILATGWHSYPAEKIENYRYTSEPDVVTNVEFEQILAACGRENKDLARPSDGSLPGRVAFIQCPGSRDLNHLPYCSEVCCSASVKQAMTLIRTHPGICAEIFYIDLRLQGRNEKLLMQAMESPGIRFTKGKVGRIEQGEGGKELLLEVEDIMAGMKKREPFDMVVLAMGLVPNPAIPGLPRGNHGFYGPGLPPGIHAAATCKRPMDVSSSVKDATASALRSMKTKNE